MARDISGNEVEVGDWIRIPDTFYPYDPNTRNIYGSICRSAQVLMVYNDGVLEAQFQQMIDLRHIGQSNPFTYNINLIASECLRVMSDDEYRGVSEGETPHVRDEQPRDAQGRFTSANTTERPTISMTDSMMADWITSMTQTNVTAY